MQNDSFKPRKFQFERDTEELCPRETPRRSLGGLKSIMQGTLDLGATGADLGRKPPFRRPVRLFMMGSGDGIIRARYRDSGKEEMFTVLGKISEFNIKLDPCSNRLNKGHCIRVSISRRNFSRFDVTSNTGEPPNDHRRKVTATNAVYHDKTHPSHIVLPVIPHGK